MALDGLEVKWARMERLGASVDELARETMEEILGFDGKGGHKAPRADIGKLKAVYDAWEQTSEDIRAAQEDLGAEVEWK